MSKLHDWGNNLISIEGNGTIHTITITKHLDSNTKCLEILLCYDFVNEITNEEKDVLLVVKLDLFTISTITLLEPKILAIMAVDAKIGIVVKISLMQKLVRTPKIDTNTKISTDMKIIINELIFYFPHTLGEILINTTPTEIKV